MENYFFSENIYLIRTWVFEKKKKNELLMSNSMGRWQHSGHSLTL